MKFYILLFVTLSFLSGCATETTRLPASSEQFEVIKAQVRYEGRVQPIHFIFNNINNIEVVEEAHLVFRNDSIFRVKVKSLEDGKIEINTIVPFNFNSELTYLKMFDKDGAEFTFKFQP